MDGAKKLWLRPPQIAFICVAVAVGAHYLVPLAYRRGISCPVCGVVTLVLGFGLMLWAAGLFSRVGTTIRPGETSSYLVTTGPYRFTRNPMYLGITLALIGAPLISGSWPMFIAPIAFFTWMSLGFIPMEEQHLRDTFGDAYEAFTKKVRRWL